MGWAQTNPSEISRNATELLEQRRAEAEVARSLAAAGPAARWRNGAAGFLKAAARLIQSAAEWLEVGRLEEQATGSAS